MERINMKSNNSSGISGGISFTGLLTIVFIVLKLCHIIKWSWLWVLAPLWISAILGVISVFIFVHMARK